MVLLSRQARCHRKINDFPSKYPRVFFFSFSSGVDLLLDPVSPNHCNFLSSQVHNTTHPELPAPVETNGSSVVQTFNTSKLYGCSHLASKGKPPLNSSPIFPPLLRHFSPPHSLPLCLLFQPTVRVRVPVLGCARLDRPPSKYSVVD